MGRPATCGCGTCPKCERREYMRLYRMMDWQDRRMLDYVRDGHVLSRAATLAGVDHDHVLELLGNPVFRRILFAIDHDRRAEELAA